jgi:membrane-bound lytic murein transglycosylase B
MRLNSFLPTTLFSVVAFVFGVIAFVPSSMAETFDEWKAAFVRDARTAGISDSTLDRALADLTPIPRVIELDRRQPEFTLTFWSYLDRVVTDTRIARGQALLSEHSALLETIEQRYGVQPRFLVAIWGLETNFGDRLGDFPLVGALATLAHDGRRSSFFHQQLVSALKLMERGDIAIDAVSSWAGAVGQPQFIPTTYEGYAVDFDGDGKRDLWDSLPDIFASASNYLQASGWDGTQTWGREVLLPSGFDYGLTGRRIRKPLSFWSEAGVRDVYGELLPEREIEASLLVPGGARNGPALLVYKNFRATLAWNNSIFYAVAVGHLADRIAGGKPFVSPRPAQEIPISRTDITEMQMLLGQLGYDPGGADGLVGPQTRGAIRSFQKAQGLPVDGFANSDLLARLRTVAGH